MKQYAYGFYDDRTEGEMFDTREDALEAGREVAIDDGWEMPKTIYVGEVVTAVDLIEQDKRFGFDIVDRIIEDIRDDTMWGDYPEEAFILSDKKHIELAKYIRDFLIENGDCQRFGVINIVEHQVDLEGRSDDD